MDFSVIFTGLLGLTLVLSPVIVGVRYLGKWRAEDRRLKRRLRDAQ